MTRQPKKVAVLIESDFYEKEIFYYEHRFPEEGMEVHFLSRLWGQPSITFRGHEQHYPFECHESFENMSDEELRSYSALIVPSGIVSDRLRWTEDIQKLPPAVEFLKRAFAEKDILKGIICHGLWLVSPVPELVRGRHVVAHNNLLGDVKNYGAIYEDKDVVVDGDLVTGRTGGHCHLFARKIIEMITTVISPGVPPMSSAPSVPFSHIAMSCKDPILVERFYAKHFGFRRSRVYAPGPGQVVVIKSGPVSLELFPANGERPVPPVGGAGPEYPGVRHVAFLVDDLDAKLAAMGSEAKLTLGPLDMGQFIAGMRVAWIADPEGNIVELNQGYVDEPNPPALP